MNLMRTVWNDPILSTRFGFRYLWLPHPLRCRLWLEYFRFRRQQGHQFRWSNWSCPPWWLSCMAFLQPFFQTNVLQRQTRTANKQFLLALEKHAPNPQKELLRLTMCLLDMLGRCQHKVHFDKQKCFFFCFKEQGVGVCWQVLTCTKNCRHRFARKARLRGHLFFKQTTRIHIDPWT